MSWRSRHVQRRVSRRTAILGGLAVVFLVLVVPMLLAAYEAHGAKSDLEVVKSSLQDGDYETAKGASERATSRVGRAAWLLDSPVGDLWASVPGIGGAVDDARLLTDALGGATDVADIGVQLYPQVTGEHATLMDDGAVSPATLDLLMSGAERAGAKLRAVDATLRRVDGDSPVIGGAIRSSRDSALDRVQPMVDAYDKVGPLVPQLGKILGMEGPKRYLIAMLNPAELRFSGGAALSLAGLTIDHGQFHLDKSLDLEDTVDPTARYVWPKVSHNPFHHRGKAMPLRNATFAPSWSVSGPELLRAIRTTFDRSYDGVITVDVVAIADLLNITGPITVPGYPTLTSDNLVKTLVGSYDTYSHSDQRHALNQAIIPAFQDRLLSGEHLSDKVQSLGHSAQGGHFALFMRDPEVEGPLRDLGFAGDLSDTTGDYIGVFTQNTNGSKVDIYQRRSIRYDVTLAPDGSADAKISVTLRSPTPPYVQQVALGPDPRSGYFTRYAGVDLGVFLAHGARLERLGDGAEPLPRLRDFYGRPWFKRSTTLVPHGSYTVTMRYHIPQAATVEDDGLRYLLTFQPQGTAIPPDVSVTVHLPPGYRATGIPSGWKSDGDTLSAPKTAQPVLETWELTARRSG